MNILLALYDHIGDSDSGAPGSMLNIAKEYKKLGHQVSCFSKDDLPSCLHPLLKTIFFPEFFAFRLLVFSRDVKLDVVDTSPGDAWLWSKISKSRSFLLVTRSHGFQYLNHIERLNDSKKGNLKLSWKYWLYRGSIQLWEQASSLLGSDLIFPLNTREKDYVVHELGISSEKVQVFPNGIPDQFINLPFEKTPLHKNSEIKLALIGSFIQRKGIQYSVPAVTELLVLYPQLRVSFLGTESRGKGTLEEVFAEINPSIRDRVSVVPRFQHSCLPKLLQGHHIKMFATLSEGFGKVLVEAMACGLAPITTPAAGPMDVVTHGDNALVVPLRDAKALQNAAEMLINDRHLLNTLRKNAYLTAQKYSWREIAQGRIAAYEEAIQRRHALECKAFS